MEELDKGKNNISYLDQKAGAGAYVRKRPRQDSDKFLITADMIPPDVYGGGRYEEAIETPNLDRLKKDGVTFSRACTVSPLCGPSRASMFTGRSPYLLVNEERAHDGMEYELRLEDEIFQQYLAREDHLVRHVGKCHVGADKFVQVFGENSSPWHRWAPPIYDDDQYLDYLREMGIDEFEFSKRIQGLKPDRKTEGNFYGGWLQKKGGGRFPLEGTYPFFLARKAMETVDVLLNKRGDEEKVYLQLDFFAPHQPFFVPQWYAQRRSSQLEGEIEPPTSYRELKEEGFSSPKGEPLIYDTYRKNWGLYETETVEDYIRTNLLQIEIVDRALGLFLDHLDKRGIYRDSVIAFCGDHGEMNGEKGLIDKGVFGHPKTVKVPFYWKRPADKDGGLTIEEPISLMDLAPTFLEMAGIEPARRLDGESLLPFMEKGSAEDHDPFLFEACWHVAPNPAVSLVSRLSDGDYYLYTYNLTAKEDEFYLFPADNGDGEHKNLLGEGGRQAEALSKEALFSLKEILEGDSRWRCYWDPFRLQHPEIVSSEEGDAQMFIPED